MKSPFPYAGLPSRQVWQRAVDPAAPGLIAHDDRAAFMIERTMRVASAGSCFARHIAAHLQTNGYGYFVTEAGGPYSARYGDIYTTLQLAQLAQRATGVFAPAEAAWERDGRYYDPFRPRAIDGGFASIGDLEAARGDHLAAVRRLFVESDVFIVTLGLTEAWVTAADGAALPLPPGAGIGTFDAERYRFINLDVGANVAALNTFIAIARELNPSLRFVLTVSPVPLAATMEPRHVVEATTYSKSVLRVAAETVRSRNDGVAYFPAYEMVAMAYDGGDHFDADRRNVNTATVARVMDAFVARFGTPEAASLATLPTIDLSLDAVDAVVAAGPPADPCDEAYLARFATQ